MPEELDTATLPAPETVESEAPDQPQHASAPETEAVAAPENEASEAAPETEAEAEPPKPRSIDDLSDEELLEHPRFKDQLARRAEAERRKTEAETAKRLAEQRKQNVMGGSIYQGLQTLAQQAAESLDGRIDAQRLNALANDLWAFNTSENYNTFDQVLAAQTPEDFRIPQKLQSQLDSAWENLRIGQGTWDDVVKARFEIAREAVRETERAALRKEIEKEVRQSLGLEATTEKQREAEQRSRGGASPTTVNGAPASSRSVSEILADPSASIADKEAAFKREYGDIRLPAY